MRAQILFALSLSASAVPFALGQGGTAAAQDEPRAPQAGDLAPTFSFDDVRASTPPAWAAAITADMFRGKVVVLEFTTSWCSGCIASVPHINTLAKDYANDDEVVILGVTYESAREADAFIKEHSLVIPLVSDPDASMFDSWWVNAVPMAAVLDREGRIACITHPVAVTREIVEKVKAGEPLPTIALKGSTDGQAPRDPYANRQRRTWNFTDLLDETGPAAIGASMTRVDAPQGMGRTNPQTGELRLLGMPPAAIIAAVHQANTRDLIMEAELPPNLFYTLIVVPPTPDVAIARELANRAIERELGVRIETRLVHSKVRLLRRAEGAPALLPVADDVERTGTSRPGMMKFSRTSLDEFASMLSRFSATPIVNATGLTAEYALDLSWDPAGGAEAARAALAAAGFVLEDGEADVKRIAVTVPRN